MESIFKQTLEKFILWLINCLLQFFEKDIQSDGISLLVSFNLSICTLQIYRNTSLLTLSLEFASPLVLVLCHFLFRSHEIRLII